MGILAKVVERIAFKTGRLRGLWVRLARPNSYRYADFLRIHGGFYGIGPDSRVNWSATITDPALVRIGRNCAIAKSDIIGHNGIIGVLQKRFPGEIIDSAGHVDIRDNSYVGHGAIILPGVTIGPNSIVAAGAVVARDVPPDCIVAGVPAKVIGKTIDYHRTLVERTKTYPWYDLVATRKGDYDAAIEPELQRIRVAHFFAGGETTADYPGTKRAAD